MKPTERCAFTSTFAIAMLAVAGFACIVFSPANEKNTGDFGARQQPTDAPSTAAYKVAAAQLTGGFR